MKYVYFSLLLMAFTGIQSTAQQVTNASKENLINYVDPFIGTDKMGHVFPGATAPFGMVQLSPQTGYEPYSIDGKTYNRKAYDYCAGYQYSDTTILGFAHTNFSGTGHSDLGDVLIMPISGELKLNPLKSEDDDKGYYSTYSHEREEASPGYYKVHLDSYGIDAELTASDRVGFHKYTFAEAAEAHIILDLVYNIYHHDNKNVWTFLRVENDSIITGYRQTNGWARTRKVFFAIQFSKAFKSYGHKKYDDILYNGFYRKFKEERNFPEMAGRDIRAYFDFDIEAGEVLQVKVALSSVSTEGAMKNLQGEIPHWEFDKVMAETQAKWEKELSVIRINTMTEEDKTVFYTALYRTCLSPIIYQDVDGRYRGLDQNIHLAEDFTNYTIFSLWDTYRALHPLFNLIRPTRSNDMIKSMLAHYDQSVHKMLPIWSHYANENWCMIGYHATSIIADAIVKEVGDFDREYALLASANTAKVPYFDGLGEYIEYGYVPDENNAYSVSQTLEYAYDDWCIAQIATAVGKHEIAGEFMQRSRNYKNVYNEKLGFMSPRLRDGEFRKNFDPMDTHGQGFIEGNAWNYGLYVPQDIEDMVEMMGGKEWFAEHLDSLFTMEISDEHIEKNEDITREGIIGNYVHGNEPSHHIPYLYNWTGHPGKTQARVRMIMDTMYGVEADGVCGNDDTGQMSAWYVFSALGFYPVLPGSSEYALGSPLVKDAEIHLENGNVFKVLVHNQSKENVYVKSIKLNGKDFTGLNLNHADIMRGGTLEFEMKGQ